MKITKFTKDKNNKYKVLIDDEEYILYDDIIVKYRLTMKEDISKDKFNKIKDENDELSSYYLSIKYLTTKMRCEKEVRDYLKKKEIEDKVIDKTIEKLKTNNFINEEIYTKSYINDLLNLSSSGPLKIKSNLIKLGIDENIINKYLNEIDDTIWYNKLRDLIEKSIRLNHASSSYMLKLKIKTNMINQGFKKYMIDDILNNIIIDDKEIYLKEKEKIKKKLEKKYEGYKLELKIKEKLYKKGFKIGDMYEE